LPPKKPWPPPEDLPAIEQGEQEQGVELSKGLALLLCCVGQSRADWLSECMKFMST
jgi:hypothetical protein